MISSTRADLSQYREEASRIIKKVAAEKEKHVQLAEVSMERETQSGDRESAVAVSKRWVEESDWVVVIVGWNYGTISDEKGADGYSVTEWEYRHASKLRKKVFVFMAGYPGTADQYRVSKEEKEDLKDWINKQTEEQKSKLEKFKQELRRCHLEMFANLHMFYERLEKTLKNTIDGLLPEIQPGTPLAELILSVMPDIQDCIRKVTMTAKCKRIHDYLHELRQHVIRPLRDEVLSKWLNEGKLSASRERVILGCVIKASRQLGGIGDVRKSIGPEHWELRDCVDKVLHQPELWNVESDPSDFQPSVENFAEALDKFAEVVQDAFTEADRSMVREESDLRERYLSLLESLKNARQQKILSPRDRQRLDGELKKVDTNRSRVKNSLTTHHRWQENHDKLHELDSFHETNLFDRKLKHYRENWLPKLLAVVDKELEHADANNAGSAKSEPEAVAAVGQQNSPPSLQGSLHECSIFVHDDLRRLREWVEALLRRDDMVAFDAAAFDKLRKLFDNAFYCIDKRTLEVVNKAGERVVDLQRWLDELVSERRMAE
jgi:hypothetical protein